MVTMSSWSAAPRCGEPRASQGSDRARDRARRLPGAPDRADQDTCPTIAGNGPFPDDLRPFRPAVPMPPSSAKFALSPLEEQRYGVRTIRVPEPMSADIPALLAS